MCVCMHLHSHRNTHTLTNLHACTVLGGVGEGEDCADTVGQSVTQVFDLGAVAGPCWVTSP